MTNNAPTVFGGAMIVAGTAIGAGMLANPTATAGVWFLWSLPVFFYTWVCTYASGLMILEASTRFESGANLSTITKALLGKGWNFVNSLSLIFVMYILLYAYITSGGGLTAQHLSVLTGSQVATPMGSVILTAIFGLFVWLSTKAVDRVASVLMIGMIVSFFVSAAGLMGTVEATKLLDSGVTNATYTPYVWVALSTLLTSFGYQIAVPSMVKYFNGDYKKVAKSVFIGTGLALVFYLIWQTVVQGNLARADFAPVIAKEGDVATLLATIGKSGMIGVMLSAFAYMALTSSFLGVALGLFDFLADALGLGNDRVGRTKTVAIVFLPPLIASLIAPFGFVTAIAFAGLALTVWGVIVPAMLARASRAKGDVTPYKAFGGSFMVYFVMAFGVINILAQLGVYFNIVPVFKP